MHSETVILNELEAKLTTNFFKAFHFSRQTKVNCFQE